MCSVTYKLAEMPMAGPGCDCCGWPTGSRAFVATFDDGPVVHCLTCHRPNHDWARQGDSERSKEVRA